MDGDTEDCHRSWQREQTDRQSHRIVRVGKIKVRYRHREEGQTDMTVVGRKKGG